VSPLLHTKELQDWLPLIGGWLVKARDLFVTQHALTKVWKHDAFCLGTSFLHFLECLW
jgi:hypothetical protein